MLTVLRGGRLLGRAVSGSVGAAHYEVLTDPLEFYTLPFVVSAHGEPRGVSMTFVQAIRSGFQNYATFATRAIRSEFWYWYLFVAIVLIVFGGIDQRLNPGLSVGSFSFVN